MNIIKSFIISVIGVSIGLFTTCFIIKKQEEKYFEEQKELRGNTLKEG